MLLNHVSVGVSDLERAAGFYDAVLGALGYGRQHEVPGAAVAYGERWPESWVGLPLDRERRPGGGNGTHVAFTASRPADVDAFHRAALGHGPADAGAPGPRPEYGPTYYGAFVVDADGNKLEACYFEIGAGP